MVEACQIHDGEFAQVLDALADLFALVAGGEKFEEGYVFAQRSPRLSALLKDPGQARLCLSCHPALRRGQLTVERDGFFTVAGRGVELGQFEADSIGVSDQISFLQVAAIPGD